MVNQNFTEYGKNEMLKKISIALAKKGFSNSAFEVLSQLDQLNKEWIYEDLATTFAEIGNEHFAKLAIEKITS